jgi:hypothetical protein
VNAVTSGHQESGALFCEWTSIVASAAGVARVTCPRSHLEVFTDEDIQQVPTKTFPRRIALIARSKVDDVISIQVADDFPEKSADWMVALPRT